MPENSITIGGNIPRAPDPGSPPSAQPTAGRGAAVNCRWQDRNSGEWQEATSFFDVICWRELAEHVSEALKRRARVILTRRLRERTLAQEGNKRSGVHVHGHQGARSLRRGTGPDEQ